MEKLNTETRVYCTTVGKDTMFSSISRKLFTEYGMQFYVPPCGSTVSVQTQFAPLRSSMKMLQLQFRLIAVRATVGVWQECLFLERIMNDALKQHEGKISGRNITNLRFADDINNLAEEEQKLEALLRI